MTLRWEYSLDNQRCVMADKYLEVLEDCYGVSQEPSLLKPEQTLIIKCLQENMLWFIKYSVQPCYLKLSLIMTFYLEISHESEKNV